MSDKQTPDEDHNATPTDPMADRRNGNKVLALCLVGFVVFIFIITMMRLGGHGQ